MIAEALEALLEVERARTAAIRTAQVAHTVNPAQAERAQATLAEYVDAEAKLYSTLTTLFPEKFADVEVEEEPDAGS